MGRRLLPWLLGLTVSCVDFDLDERWFRCDGDPAICGPGLICGADGYCREAAAYEDCTNGIEDDGDGDIDCADSECPGVPTCGPGCVCDENGPLEAFCMDLLDNDNDSMPDCLDLDCGECPNQFTCCPNGACQLGC